ncbi:MAG: S-layer homology domain-containing protein [Lachnospirales bacterium]
MCYKRIKKIIAFILIFSFIFTSIPTVDIFASSKATLNSALSDFKMKDILYTDVEGLGKENVSLEWNSVDYSYDDGTTAKTRYYLARRKINNEDENDTSGEYKWEIRGNYEPDQIRVLNIYPKVGNGFQLWMEELQRAFPEISLKIQTSQVSLETFNKRPQEYLWKNSDGTYYYDVVVFGFWDSNNYMDISKATDPQNYPVSAYDYIQDYIDAGYGVVFGHDTAQYKVDSTHKVNPNFSELLTENSSLVVTPFNDKVWTYSDKIAVDQQSTFTTYPFDIAGYDLVIPMSHTVNQYASDPSDVYVTFEKNYYPTPSDGPYYNYNIRGAKDTSTYTYGGVEYQSNSYLMVDGNVAFIQCGHSSGKTNTAEQAVLANTIYALTQMRTSTKAVDRILDTDKPTAPIPVVDSTNNNKVTFNTEDTGTRYKYRVIAEPLGYGDSVSKNWDTIKTMLDNSANTPFTVSNINNGTNIYAISDTKVTHEELAEVKGSVGSETDKTAYEYYIDTKEIGQRLDEETGTNYVEYGKTYDISSLADGLGEGQYLHVWAYDNVDNISVNNTSTDVASATTENGLQYNVTNGITNINLWTVTPEYPAMVNYNDTLGSEIVSSVITEEIFGSTYEPPITYFEGYRYIESTPDKSLIVSDDASQNVITHIYGEIIEKPIYAIKHNSDGTVASTTLVKTVQGLASDKFTLVSPTYDNYNYVGYNNVEDSTVDALLTPTELEIQDNNPLYLHYEPKTGTVKVVVSRSDDGSVLSEYTVIEEVNAGTPVLVLGDKILNEYIIDKGSDDTDCYTNGTEVSINHTVIVNEGENILSIVLKPRTKTVVHYGINFENSRKIEVLNSEAYTYDGENTTIDVGRISTDWEPIDDAVITKTVDFSEILMPVYIFGYYKGLLPGEVSYYVNYYNVIDNSTIYDSETFTGKIDDFVVREFKGDTAISIEGNYVDFELESIEPHEDEHILNIYYRPYSTITYSEYIKSESTEEKVKSKTYKELFGEPLNIDSYINDSNKDLYELIDFEENGSPTNKTYSQLTATDTYFRNVDIYLRPKTYDFKVEVVDNAEISKATTRKYVGYSFENVKINESVTFIIPKEYGGYTLIDVEAGENTSQEYFTYVESSDGLSYTVTFNPNMIEGNYSIKAIYGIKTKATLTYALINRGKLEVKKKDEVEAYIGDIFEYTVPDLTGLDNGYKVEYAYLDGKLYETSENSYYNIPITKANQNLYVVYSAIPTLKVETSVNPTGAGIVTGNLDESNNNILYAKGDKVDLSAVANEGYVFDSWTVVSKNVDLGTLSTYSEIYFNMPSSNVVLQANFIKEDDHTTIDGYNTLVVNTTEGGDAIGSGLFKEGDSAKISASPNSGYSFSGWVFEKQNGATIGNAKEKDTVITMPNKGVVIKATFTSINTGGGGNEDDDDDDIDIEIDDEDDVTNPVVPVKPNIPFLPELPKYEDLPTDLNELNSLIYILERRLVPYIQGYDDLTVQPDGDITRAEVVQIIYNLYGRRSVIDESYLENFSDVTENEWYSDALAYAYKNNVINGYEDGTFRPNEPITRAEVAVIIAKFSNKNIGSTTKVAFSDIDTEWARESIEKLVSNGIINGFPDGTFRPNERATRGQLVTLVNNLLDRSEDYNTYVTYPDLNKDHWAYDDIMNASNGSIYYDDFVQYFEDVKEYMKNN